MSSDDKTISENKEMEKDFLDEGGKSKSKFIYILSFSLLFLILAAAGVYFYISRPSKIMTNAIDTLYDSFYSLYSNSLNNNETMQDYDTVLTDFNFKFDTNFDGLEDLNKESINIKTGYDIKNNSVSMDLSWLEDNNRILGLLYYVINEGVFAKLDDYDKLIRINEYEDVNFSDYFVAQRPKTNSLEIEDISKLKDILIKSLDMSVLEKDTATLKVNGKDKKVNRITYDLNKNNVKNLVSNFVDNINNDKKLLEKFSEIYGLSTQEIKNSFEQLKSSDFEDIGKIKVYTGRIINKIYGMELTINGVTFGVTFNDDSTLIYVDYLLNKILFDINKVTENEINVDYTIASNVTLNGNFNITEKKISDTKFSGVVSFNIKYFLYDFGFKGDYTVLINADIPSIDTSNSVNMSDISEADTNNIMTNIMEKFQKSNLASFIQSFVGDESLSE